MPKPTITCSCGCGREEQAFARGLIARCYMMLYRKAPHRLLAYPKDKGGRPLGWRKPKRVKGYTVECGDTSIRVRAPTKGQARAAVCKAQGWKFVAARVRRAPELDG